METLNEAIRTARQVAGLSQMDLIRKINTEYGVSISSSMLSRYENPTQGLAAKISLPALFTICTSLNLDLNLIAQNEAKILKDKHNNI